MNKRQSNKFNSYQSVQGVLEDNQNIYEGVPIINQSVESFLSVVNEIDQILARTEMDTTGETSAKDVAKEKLATLATSLAASGSVYAFEAGDVELEAALGYTYSDLRYCRDAEALAISRTIESELRENFDAVTEYLISEENLNELHQAIEEFDNASEAKGGVKSGSVAETRTLSILFRVADDLLNKRLDRFVDRLKVEFPKFYVAYNNARMIVDL